MPDLENLSIRGTPVKLIDLRLDEKLERVTFRIGQICLAKPNVISRVWDLFTTTAPTSVTVG